MRRGSAIVIVACALVPAVAAHGQNLTSNPGFEAGNTAFSSDYSFSAGGNCCEGQYTVRNNGSTFNGAFVNPPPSTPGSVLMMVVNGSTAPGVRIWYQTVAVSPGVRYQLSMRGCTAVAGGPAVLQWQIDGTLVGSPTSLPAVTRAWIDVTAPWTAPPGASSVVVAIRNLNTSSFPNDFYIDDLSMRPVCPADFNSDGVLDPDDLSDYIACYFGMPACPQADFNGDGNLDPDDLSDYIAAYFSGC